MASKNLRGITIEIGGNTSKLGKALEDSEKKSRSLDTELRQIQQSLKFNPANVELLSQKQTVLTQNVAETTKKLDTLKEAERQVIAQFERGEVAEAQVRELHREILKAENQLDSMNKELKSTTDLMDDVARGTRNAGESTEDYKKRLDEASQELEDFKDTATTTLGVLASGVGALGASASATAGYALTISTEFDKAFNTLQTRTGATAEEMVELEESISNIYKNNFGESIEDVAESMAIVKTQTNLVGQELETTTQNALMLRDTFGFEVNESIRAVNSMMNQFGITADEAYTLIAQGAQNGLNQNDDLLDTINEYSVQFSMLGYNADDMFNMLKNGANEGTWSIDKLGDAVKEFNIRAKDGSDSTAGAFAQLGLTVGDNSEALGKAREKLEKYQEQIAKLETNVHKALLKQTEFNDKTSEVTKFEVAKNIEEWQKEIIKLNDEMYNTTLSIDAMEKANANGGQSASDLFARFAEGGETAKLATQEVLGALMSMEDKVQQDAVGVALFGTMWEDLGADAINALMSTQGEIDKTSDALQKINETKYDDIGSALSGLKRTLETDVIEPLGEELKPVVEEAIDYVKDNAPAIKEVLTNIVTAVGNFVKMVVDNKDAIIGTIVAIGAGFLAWKAVTIIVGIVSAMKLLITTVQGGKLAWDALNLAMKANVIGLIIGAITALVAGFIYLWNNCEGFRNFWIGLWDGIVSAVTVAVDWIKGAFDAVVSFFTDNWQSILLFILNPFAGAFSYLYENFEGFRNFVDGIINAIKEFFVNLGSSIASIASNIWANIVAIFSPAIAWFSALFTSIYNTLASIVNVVIVLIKGCWTIITTVFGIAYEWFSNTVITPVREAFSAFWTTISTLASNAWTTISTIFSVVAGWFNETIISPVSTFFGNMWTNLISGASEAWTGIKNVFSVVTSWFKTQFTNAWTGVKNVFSTGGKIFSGITEGITSTFKTVVNGIIGGINKVVSVPFGAINGALNTIRNVSVAGLTPFSGLPTISTPQIPLLYRGGILKKGQVGLLEGNGAEAVVPLEKETGWIERIAQKMNDMQGSNYDAGALSMKMDEMIQTMKNLKSTIVLDTGVLVGETINQIDEGLGDNYSMRERRI